LTLVPLWKSGFFVFVYFSEYVPKETSLCASWGGCSLHPLLVKTSGIKNNGKEIRAKGATLRSLTEPWLTADGSPQSELLMNIFSSLAEFERKMTLQRQREGIALAKQRGAYKGRPPKLTKNNARVRVALEEFARGKRPVRQICELYGISRASLYRIAKAEGIERGQGG